MAFIREEIPQNELLQPLTIIEKGQTVFPLAFPLVLNSRVLEAVKCLKYRENPLVMVEMAKTRTAELLTGFKEAFKAPIESKVAKTAEFVKRGEPIDIDEGVQASNCGSHSAINAYTLKNIGKFQHVRWNMNFVKTEKGFVGHANLIVKPNDDTGWMVVDSNWVNGGEQWKVGLYHFPDVDTLVDYHHGCVVELSHYYFPKRKLRMHRNVSKIPPATFSLPGEELVVRKTPINKVSKRDFIHEIG